MSADLTTMLMKRIIKIVLILSGIAVLAVLAAVGLNKSKPAQQLVEEAKKTIATFTGSTSSGGGGGGETTTPTPTVPAVVQGVTVDQSTAGRLVLSWNAATGALSYKVLRSATQVGTYTEIAAPTATNYSDTAVTAGSTYFYRVVAINNTGESAVSDYASGTVQTTSQSPATPTGVAVSNATPGQLVITWNAVSGATGYSVRRSTSAGGTYAEIATPAGTEYINNGLTNGTTFYYKVVAVNITGSSAASAIVSATVTASPSVPAAPTGLTIYCPNNGQTITEAQLSWTDNANNETSYSVERDSTNSSMPNPLVIVENLPANTASYTDSVFNATDYWYRVVAHNAQGRSTSTIVHAVANSGTTTQ